jgi:hypothetical protein
MLPMPPEHAWEIERDPTAYRQATPAWDRADWLLECFLRLPWSAPRIIRNIHLGGPILLSAEATWRIKASPVIGIYGDSVSEEQPKKDYHRNWHTQQPEQYAATHISSPYCFENNAPIKG